MKIVWFLSIAFFVLLFNTGTVSTIAFRIIVNKLPILPESKTSKDGISVANSTECQTFCKDSRNYLFAEGIGGPRCFCSNESKPFRYGLVNSPGAVFKSEVRDVKGIDFFIYMGIKPVEIQEIIRPNIQLIKSVDTCALLCYSMKIYLISYCWAFSFDVDPLAKQPCRLFGESKRGTRYEEIASNSTLMYFGRIGSFLTKFSRRWGLLTSETNYKSRKYVEPSLTTKEQPYNFVGLKRCAVSCYEDFHSKCDHLYYDIVKRKCYFNTLPEEVKPASMFDPKFLYFRQDRTKDCSDAPIPTFFTSGEFRSPGFPYSYDTEPCSWKFLTPLGRALSLTLTNALPERDVCKESIQINNASARICQTDKQIVGQSDDGVNTVELKPSQTESSGFAFVASYESQYVYACRPGRKQLLLQGSGSIATADWPKAMKPSVCRWKISANGEKQVEISIKDIRFVSDTMLRSATLRLTDGKGKSVLCNSTSSCKPGQQITLTSPIDVDFDSGMYFQFPDGFLLSYSFDGVFPNPNIQETKTLTLYEKDQVLTEAKYGLQLSYTSTLKYVIKNTITDFGYKRIVLTLDTILLGQRSPQPRETGICIGGSMEITDPAINRNIHTYSFCHHKENGTRIISVGNTLTVKVWIPPQSHVPHTIPPKSFKFSVTNYEDKIERTILLNSSLTFTSPNYPKPYPPNANTRWDIANVNGTLAVLSLLDINLGRYQVLTKYFCNNDRLVIHIGTDVKVLNCSIPQEELPMRFVQQAPLAVVLATAEQYLGSGFKANIEYFNKVECNETQDPVVIKGPGPIISANYLSTNAGPCQWRLDMDLDIDCLEGCDQVKFIKPNGNLYFSFGESQLNGLFKGTIVEWRGNERAKYFSALVSDKLPSTSGPSSKKFTFRPTTPLALSSTSTSFGEVVPPNHHGSLWAGAIAGIILGVLFAAIVVVTLVLLLLRRSGHNIEIYDRVRNSFANIKNPFSRHLNETSAPYKSFVDNPTASSKKKDDIAVTYHKEENGGTLNYEVNVSQNNVPPGHLQVGGFDDITITDS